MCRCLSCRKGGRGQRSPDQLKQPGNTFALHWTPPVHFFRCALKLNPKRVVAHRHQRAARYVRWRVARVASCLLFVAGGRRWSRMRAQVRAGLAISPESPYARFRFTESGRPSEPPFRTSDSWKESLPTSSVDERTVRPGKNWRACQFTVTNTNRGPPSSPSV